MARVRTAGDWGEPPQDMILMQDRSSCSTSGLLTSIVSMVLATLVAETRSRSAHGSGHSRAVNAGTGADIACQSCMQRFISCPARQTSQCTHKEQLQQAGQQRKGAPIASSASCAVKVGMMTWRPPTSVMAYTANTSTRWNMGAKWPHTSCRLSFISVEGKAVVRQQLAGCSSW